MGCGSSSGKDPCPDEEKLDWKDESVDSELSQEDKKKRVFLDKKTGKSTKK